MKIFREIVKNTDMGIQSVKNLLPYVEDEKLKAVMDSQKAAMEDFLVRAKKELTCEEQEQADGTKFQKTMLKAGVSVNAMFNNDPTHIADMLIEGYDMGINSVVKCQNELRRQGNELPPLADELIKFYDKSVKALRAFL